MGLSEANSGGTEGDAPVPHGPRLGEGVDPANLKAITLSGEQLVPYRSEYLMHGYKRDQTQLSRVELSKGSIRGWLNVTSYDMPSDGHYHFTAPLALVWVAQLGIIYGCIDNNLSAKLGEAYLRDFNIVCRKPVNQTEGIELSLELIAKHLRGANAYYKGSFLVNGGSFSGNASFVLPVANQKS